MVDESSSENRLKALQTQLAALERSADARAMQSARPEPLPAKPKARTPLPHKWMLFVAQGWGALMFLLFIYQSADQTPVWQLVLLGLFISALGWGWYGIQLFYIQLGKDIANAWSRHRSRRAAGSPRDKA